MHDMTRILQSADILLTPAILLFVVAGLIDVATRTVPNLLCVCVLALGLISHFVDHTIFPALLTSGVVFLLSFVAWVTRLFGGGDAKLLSAAAFLVPAQGAFDLILATALFGGALSIFYIVVSHCLSPVSTGAPHGSLRRVFYMERQRIVRRESLPYAVAIAGGAIFTMIRY